MMVASVRDFLAEIQQLNLEKEGLEAVNPTKAAYLQSQIWRNITIVQCLMDSCPEAKEVLEEEILRKRRELKAEAKDLRLMQVPQAVDAKIVQGWQDAEEGWRAGPFPYLELPPEVRREFLGYLDCPNDQLNMGDVLPADGHMMGWNKNALQFEKVLSILLSREMLTYEDIKSLILAGHYMQIAASNWFKAFLKEFFRRTEYTYYYQNAAGGGLRELQKLTSDEFAANPIPACILIDLMSNEYEEDEDSDLREEKQFQILRVIGHNISDCHIWIDGMTMMESMTRIKDSLTLMPNVKYVRLDLSRFADYPNPDADDISYFDNVELPDLPTLRGLKLGWIRCDASATKVLRRYGRCLTHLQTMHLPLVPPEDALLFPKLTMVDLGCGFFVEDAQPMVEIARLGNLAGSPLKVVHFDIYHHQRRIPDYFRNLLCCLNQFGGTLEELDLTFSSEYVSDSGRERDLTWLGHIEFPKVKKLIVRNRPDTWNFLLHFPVLETLAWSYVWRDWGCAFESGACFGFSRMEREMCTSSLWKMLPFLKSIVFFESCGFKVEKVVFTRSDAMAYQEKYGKPKRKSKAERRQENLNWGTRKSARIASMQNK